MINDKSSYQQEVSQIIEGILSGYDDHANNEHKTEDLYNLSTVIIQKHVKKLNEQIIFFNAENRLLSNYIIWYEKRMFDIENDESQQLLASNHDKIYPSYLITKDKHKNLLTIEKKREIAEICFKILVSYSQKYTFNTTQHVDKWINTIENLNETIVHFDFELILLKRITSEELIQHFHDRIRYWEALNKRIQQKTVRLRSNLIEIEKSIRKMDQVTENATDIDFEQLKIDIEKQLKELNSKNKMLIFYKRQQSEANLKFNITKPELIKNIRELTSIRNEINDKIVLLKHYDKIKERMQNDINQYEKLNDPLRQMSLSYRVPSIVNYVELKSKQMHLHRQYSTWQRKIEIAKRELKLRQIESKNLPEKIIHPWKFIQNPSPILFQQQYKLYLNRTNVQ